MKTGIKNIAAAFGMIVLLMSGCNKTPDQIEAPKCNDFNNRQNIYVKYNDTVAVDMANYFEGQPCTFRWKLAAVDGCENAPIELKNKITILADDTTVTVKMGYQLEETGETHYIAMKRSDPYNMLINGTAVKVVDLTNSESTFNKCTTCNGSDPVPINTSVEVTMPSTGHIETDKTKLRDLVKSVYLNMTYVYDVD